MKQTVQEALQSIVDNKECKALNYCVNYAIVAQSDPNKTQLLYVLNNMTHWRGDLAKQVRATLKEATK